MTPYCGSNYVRKKHRRKVALLQTTRIKYLEKKMARSTFNPGFRLSFFDIVILAAGLVGSIILGSQIWWAGMVVGLVVFHFFLFCNVFRVSRSPELIWGATFIALAGLTILIEFPGWITTTVLSIAMSSFLIWRETKKKDYHGIYWKRWNPSLFDWWTANRATSNSGQISDTDQQVIDA